MKPLDEHLCCPKCNRVGKVIFHQDFLDIRQVTCGFCGYKLPVYNGIPDFAEHIVLSNPVFRPLQIFNNSRLFASLYESPWRLFLTVIGSGISMKQEIQEVTGIAGKVSAHVLVDLACYTGFYTRAFAHKWPEALVYGLDISLSMLEQARKVARRKGLKSIVFLRGDLYRLPFNDESIDYVNCGGALHLFSNLRPIWREISRVLRPGGILGGWTLTWSPWAVYRKVQKWLMDHWKFTFLRPDQFAVGLSEVGLCAFKYRQRNAWLIFCATKNQLER